MGPTNNMINNLSFVAIAVIGTVFTLEGYSTIGITLAFFNYIQQFTRPLSQISQLYNTIQSAIAGAERVFEVMDEQPDLEDKLGAHSFSDIQGDVSFEHVDFGLQQRPARY